MVPPVSVERLLRDIQLMFEILRNNESLATRDEREKLDSFYGKLQANRSIPINTPVSEALEREFYSLLEAYPNLRKVQFAATYLELVKSCSSTIAELKERARVRAPTPDESKQEEVATAVLRQVQEQLDAWLS